MANLQVKKEENSYIETVWEEWEKLVREGYGYFEKQKAEEGLKYWAEAWKRFQSVMEEQTEVFCSLD